MRQLRGDKVGKQGFHSLSSSRSIEVSIPFGKPRIWNVFQELVSAQELEVQELEVQELEVPYSFFQELEVPYSSGTGSFRNWKSPTFFYLP
jgi:hypothetical protein